MLSWESEVAIIECKNRDFGYKIVAELVSLEKRIFDVDGILIAIAEYIPGGLSVGDRVEFECDRIDLW